MDEEFLEEYLKSPDEENDLRMDKFVAIGIAYLFILRLAEIINNSQSLGIRIGPLSYTLRKFSDSDNEMAKGFANSCYNQIPRIIDAINNQHGWMPSQCGALFQMYLDGAKKDGAFDSYTKDNLLDYMESAPMLLAINAESYLKRG